MNDDTDIGELLTLHQRIGDLTRTTPEFVADAKYIWACFIETTINTVLDTPGMVVELVLSADVATAMGLSTPLIRLHRKSVIGYAEAIEDSVWVNISVDPNFQIKTTMLELHLCRIVATDTGSPLALMLTDVIYTSMLNTIVTPLESAVTLATPPTTTSKTPKGTVVSVEGNVVTAKFGKKE